MSVATLFRKVHKWLGLAVGLQVILWCASGAAMALIDHEAVNEAPLPEAMAPWPKLAPPPAGPFDALVLRRIAGRPAYEVRRNAQVELIDAATGEPIAIGDRLAVEVARSAFGRTEPLRGATLLRGANLESRGNEGPIWRIDFADGRNSSAYVSAETGRPLVVRTDLWRSWDFAWMLHNMDYGARTNFNHPLIVLVTFLTLWLTLSGFYLIFKSFRRRDFRL